MKRIVLHGRLKELYPAEILLDVKSAAEAIKGLGSLTHAFDATPARPRLCLRAIGFNSDAQLFAPTDAEEIHLILDMSGGGGAFKIVLGVALVAVGFFTGGTTWGPALMLFGASMILQGVLDLLSPAPKTQDPNAQTKYFGPPGNTVKIGTRIPVLYGMFQVYGQFISFDVVTDQLVLVNATGSAPVPAFGPPTALLLTPYLTGIALTWVNNTSPDFLATEVWSSAGADFVGATLLTSTTDHAYNDELGGTDGAPVQRWYWFRTQKQDASFSAFSPDSGTAGLTAVTARPETTGDGGGHDAGDAGNDTGDSGDGSSSDGDGGGDGGDGSSGDG